MYLLRPYLLLLSVCALPGNASPASPPILPNRPSNISDAGNTLNSTSPLGANGWPFTDRPVGLDYHINDYNIRAQVTRPTIPDSGDGDPQKISKALKVISVWIPTQENPDGSFPRSLRYEGVTDGVKYTFIAGEVRWDLNTEMVSPSRHHLCFLLPLAPNIRGIRLKLIR